VEEMMNLDVLEEALAVRAAVQIKDTAAAITNSQAPLKEKDNDLFAQMKVNMVRAHINYLVFVIFRRQIETHAFKDQRIKPLLNEIGRIWAINSIVESIGPIFDTGYFAPSASKLLTEALDILVRRLRPQLIPLVETKAQSDLVSPSNIGNSYGDIYEQQLEWAMDSSMNKLDKDGVPPQWEEYMKPFLHEEPVAKHNKALPATVRAKL